jgi:hypothetical protein
MERSDAGVTPPGEHQPGGAACADQLIVDEVRCHAHERQLAASLADDFVPGGEGNEVREALHGDDVPIMDHRLDGVAQRAETRHDRRAFYLVFALTAKCRPRHAAADISTGWSCWPSGQPSAGRS